MRSSCRVNRWDRSRSSAPTVLRLAAFFRAAGAEPIDLGIAPDNRAALQRLAAGAAGADLLVTSGGASVGDHDLVKAALGEQGMAVDFWKIAMRPGKPLMFGSIGATKVIGLPGNPVSSTGLRPGLHSPGAARHAGRARGRQRRGNCDCRPRSGGERQPRRLSARRTVARQRRAAWLPRLSASRTVPCSS